jgi:chaperonin cofactor prefoldin
MSTAPDPITIFVNQLKESGETAFNRLSEQLLENPVFMKALQRTVEAKGHVDRTVAGTLDFVNVVSKNDVQRILEEIEELSNRLGRTQRAVASIERLLEDIKAAIDKMARPARK